MFNLRNLTLLVAATLSLHISSIKAEIKEVTFQWPSILCKDSCVRGLEQQLRKIRGVTDVSINGPQGQAHLKWDPQAPFSYRSIEAAVAWIGLGFEDLHVTVRGNIVHNERDVILVSLGDNSRFYLMNHPPDVPNRFVEQNSPFNRTLTPQMRAQLLDAERNHQIVTISGPLFHPETSPPLYLTVESLNMSENPNIQRNLPQR